MAPIHLCARSVCCAACAVSGASWLLFTGVRARCAVPCVRCPGPLGPCSPVCSLGVLCCVCGVRGHSAPGHPCARSVCCVACAVSGASWLLFTGVLARCAVLRVRCPGPLGSCSPVCMSVVCCCACGALCAQCPGPLCSLSPVCSFGVSCCVCGVRGRLAPVHRFALSVCCVACAVSRASWLLCSGVRARCVVLRVRFSGPLGSCSPVCVLCVLCCACGVLCLRCAPSCMHAAFMHSCHDTLLCCVCGVRGLLAPVHRCACALCCVVCAVSWATWLLFTGAPA